MSGIDQAISKSTGCTFRNCSSSSIGGGCINQTSRIIGEDGREYFIKKNQSSFLAFFEAEASALTEICKTKTVRAPQVIAHGLDNEQAFLVLEYIEEGRNSSNGQVKLGTQLARLHRVSQPYFGWSTDNCIGATPQPNPDRITGPHSIGITDWLINSISLQTKAENLRVLKNYSIRSNLFFPLTPLTPPCSTGTCGAEMQDMTSRASPSSLIQLPIMATARPISPSPICLVDFPHRFMMPTKRNTLSTQVFANVKPSTISTMNSIISIYSVVAMETLPSPA